MENNYPIYKILSWMFIALSLASLQLFLFTDSKNDMFLYAKVGQVTGFGIGGILGLMNWKVARWWLTVFLIISIGFTLYETYMSWLDAQEEINIIQFFQGDLNIYLLELSVLIDSMFTFLLIGTIFIFFNGQVHSQLLEDKNKWLHHLPIYKIIALILLSFGIAFLLSVYSPVIFEGKALSTVDYSWMVMVPICMGIGILCWFNWKVMRMLLTVFFVLLFGSVVYFTVKNEGIDFHIIIQILLWGSFLFGMLLIFLNEKIKDISITEFAKKENENILDAF